MPLSHICGHMTRVCWSQCPSFWPQWLDMREHVTEAGPITVVLWNFWMFWDDDYNFLQPKSFFSQREWRYHTERSTVEKKRDLIISFRVLDLGMWALDPPFSFRPAVFCLGYFELCFGHFNWKMSPDWKDMKIVFWSFAFLLASPLELFWSQITSQRLLRWGLLTHDINLRLAQKISLQRWQLFGTLCACMLSSGEWYASKEISEILVTSIRRDPCPLGLVSQQGK